MCAALSGLLASWLCQSLHHWSALTLLHPGVSSPEGPHDCVQHYLGCSHHGSAKANILSFHILLLVHYCIPLLTRITNAKLLSLTTSIHSHRTSLSLLHSTVNSTIIRHKHNVMHRTSSVHIFIKYLYLCLCILYVCLLCCTHTLSVHAADTHFNFNLYSMYISTH